MGCDSQLTVKPRKNSASLVDIILFSSCQMHPTKQEVHPTFRPVHPTCRIVSKWPTFSNKKVSFVHLAKETFLRDAFLAERDAHCVRDAASPVMHAFGACAERIASPITAQRYHLSLICKAEHFTKPKGQYFTSFSFSFFIFSICFNCTFTQHDSLPSK